MQSPDPVDLNSVREHLREEYSGVFDDAMIEVFLDEYVGTTAAAPLLERVLAACPNTTELLDVGCGYGAFVLVARNAGLSARGVDLAEFELAFARTRYRRETPDDALDHAYLRASALALPFKDASFDVVTAWNVIEHIPDLARLAAEVHRILRPDGVFLALAPNYASLRREAHYQVVWPPLLPRRFASTYLRMRGRNPSFFEQSIHYRTLVGVQRELRRAGFVVQPLEPPQLAKLRDLSQITRPAVRRALQVVERANVLALVESAVRVNARNPLRRSIDVVARRA